MAVEDIIAQQQAFANASVTSATAFLDKLADIADSHWFVQSNIQALPGIGYSFDTTDEVKTLLNGLFPAALTTGAISGTVPTFTPVPVDPSSITDLVVPDLTAVAPVLNIPAPPSAALPSVPVAPSISDPVLPAAPTITLPVAPVVTGITFPDVPSITIPEFTSTLPIDDLVTPSNTFTFNEELYNSALLDATKAKLLDRMINGGYGIEPNDEAALWDRARAREIEAAAAQADTIIADAAARGFPLPPGDMNVSLQKAQQDLLGKVSTANRDIMLKRADLYVENYQFTIKEARDLENMLIGYHNSRMERALNAAGAVLDASVKIFNAQVARYNARLAAYQADGQVFEARVRAQLAQVEIYRAQMDGKRLEVEVQKARVEIYNAQLQGVHTVVDIYTAQLNAAQVQAGIERLRIDTFKALIDAYSAQVQAKAAEFGMFESQVRGEIAKMQGFEAQVRGYTASVEAAKAKSDVMIARLRAQIDVSNQAVKVYEAQIETYKADIAAQAQTIQAKTAVYSAQVQGASAEMGALSAAYNLDVTKKSLEFQRNAKNAELAIEDAKLLLQGLVTSADSRIRAGTAAAQYTSAAVAGALSALGTLSATIQQV
jgi:hypothetical protein